MTELPVNKIIWGDCIEVMKDFPDKSVDMVLCDLPYGVIECEWDVVIPFPTLWRQYKRIIKDTAAIVLTATQPFTTLLISSNLAMFKYCWYWKKTKPNGWPHSKNRPMTIIEECCVFSKAPSGHLSQLGESRMVYNPQGVVSDVTRTISKTAFGSTLGSHPNQVGKVYESFTGFPNNLLKFANITGSQVLHPTQKPVGLFEYLIQTYTSEGDVVLDNCIGSGTTAVAAINTNRKFIGIDSSRDYCSLATNRAREAALAKKRNKFSRAR